MRSIMLIALSMIISTAAHATCSPQDIANTYTGYIAGGGPNSTTTFTANGTLGGHYKMSQAGEGSFSELQLTNNVLTGKWTDQFGTGVINFVFAADCKSFDGTWNGSGLWNGAL